MFFELIAILQFSVPVEGRELSRYPTCANLMKMQIFVNDGIHNSYRQMRLFRKLSVNCQESGVPLIECSRE